MIIPCSKIRIVVGDHEYVITTANGAGLFVVHPTSAVWVEVEEADFILKTEPGCQRITLFVWISAHCRFFHGFICLRQSLPCI